MSQQKKLRINSKFGKITLVECGGFLTHLIFEKGCGDGTTHNDESAVLLQAKKQLEEYFDGGRKVFDIPLRPAGGEFFRRVWQVMLDDVAFGTTITYGGLGKLVGSPKGARAIGMANNKNPIPIIIPCHRVVGANGSLTGYAFGLDIKQKLLELEGLI